MYRIFTYIYHTFKPIVGQYSSPMEHMGNICMSMSIFYISGQIIIFHGSLGRISLFQIWNKVRSQKSRNSKWGRIVICLQTTENLTFTFQMHQISWFWENVSWIGPKSQDLKFDETVVSMFFLYVIFICFYFVNQQVASKSCVLKGLTKKGRSGSGSNSLEKTRSSNWKSFPQV